MFENGFPRHWSTLKKLIWLFGSDASGASGTSTTVKGTSPLTLVNALAKRIKKLTQYGKCTVSGTDITCNNGAVKYDSELGIYADGTPEEIRVTASGADDQTATASNLFAVGSIADEQDIISGTITRRCEAVVSDGSTPSGRYIGTVGEGNIIVQTKETGYSGAIASFTTDKAKPLSGLVAEIEPVQDLHGQSSPYPPGGGVNKFNVADATSSQFSISGETFTNTSTDSRTKFFLSWQIFNGNTLVTYGLKEASTTERIDCTLTIDAPCTRMVIKHNGSNADLIINCPWTQTGTWTISMNVVSNNPSVVGGLVLSNIQIESGSTATAWSPYSNICPISGWTGLSGWRRGGNVIDWTYGQSQTNSGITSSGVVDDCKAVFSGTATATIGFTLGRKAVKNGETYTITVKGVDSTHSINCRAIKGDLASGGEYISMVKNFNSDGSYTFTCDGTYNIVDFRPTFQSGAVCNNYEMFFAITGGTNPASFEPVNSEVISVSWQDTAGTVYGGTLDVVSGLLTVTDYAFDLGSLTWSNYQAENHRFSANITSYPSVSNNHEDGICSIYNVTGTGPSALPNGTIKRYDSGNYRYIYICDYNFTDASQIASALSGELFVVKLTTPITYQLTPQEVDTLVGQNNVWVDTGDVTAYVPDFTTEKVAGQSLSTTDGTNTVFVTSNVDPVELEAKYRTQ